MNVVLSFDIEVWCDGWDDLDKKFDASFDRYMYGRSRHGEYALPKTLEILNRHRLHGVFFVEPLFAARFGRQHLRTVVDLIQGAGQEVQLHLHPEWTDEIRPLLFEGATVKRQHLSYYTLEEQKTLIATGRDMLREAGVAEVSAFRAGSFAANRDTYRALAANGIFIDASLNQVHADSGPDMRGEWRFDAPFEVDGVRTFPMSIFRDGLGKARPAQLGSCSSEEMRAAIEAGRRRGDDAFVVLSHNFEMLKPGRAEPDWFVVRRFERLCTYLDRNRDTLPTCGFDALDVRASHGDLPLQVAQWPTLKRFAEQALRRFA